MRPRRSTSIQSSEPTVNGRNRFASVHNLVRFSQQTRSNRRHSSIVSRGADEHGRYGLQHAVSPTRELAFGSGDAFSRSRKIKISWPCWGRIVFALIIMIAAAAVFFVRYYEKLLEKRLCEEYGDMRDEKERQSGFFEQYFSGVMNGTVRNGTFWKGPGAGAPGNASTRIWPLHELFSQESIRPDKTRYWCFFEWTHLDDHDDCTRIIWKNFVCPCTG